MTGNALTCRASDAISPSSRDLKKLFYAFQSKVWLQTPKREHCCGGRHAGLLEQNRLSFSWELAYPRIVTLINCALFYMGYGLWHSLAARREDAMATKRIVLLIAITALLIASTAVPALALLANGQAAPNFQLKDLSGTSHTLSEYRGKVVVIDFFGYACGYCQGDAKDTLVPLYNTYYKNDPNVQFLGVEVDGGSICSIRQFVQITGAPWPLLPSGEQRVFSAYQSSTPTVYVISPAGTVASSSVYPTNPTTLRATIDALEGSVAPARPGPAVCAQGSNTLALFIQGRGGALYWKHWNGATWSAWASLGGYATSDPAATSPSSRRDRRLYPRRRRRRLGEDHHERRRHLERLDLARRAARPQQRTGGLLMERRSSRRLCTRRRRRPLVENV